VVKLFEVCVLTKQGAMMRPNSFACGTLVSFVFKVFVAELRWTCQRIAASLLVVVECNTLSNLSAKAGSSFVSHFLRGLSNGITGKNHHF